MSSSEHTQTASPKPVKTQRPSFSGQDHGQPKAPTENLMDLSTDLLTLIASYVVRPLDMVNLCLTCKRFHEITVRHLYQTVELDLGGHADRKLAAFLNPRNIGIPHIRNIKIWHVRDPRDKAQSKQVQFAIAMLLEALPRNQLERFRSKACLLKPLRTQILTTTSNDWHQSEEFSIDNLKTLYRRQKKLKWLEAMTLSTSLDNRIKRQLDFDSVMKDTEEVGLWLDSVQAIEMAGEITKRVKKLKNLTIRLSLPLLDNPSPSLAQWNDTITGPGRVTSGVFNHMMPFEECTPIEVSSLMLEDLNMTYCRGQKKDTYTRVIDMTKLTSLKIHNCSSAHSLLSELSRSSRLPTSLRILEFKHKDDYRNSEGFSALDEFLCLVSHLEELVVDISCARDLPSTDKIARHGKTLRVLSLHASSDDVGGERCYRTPDFETIATMCTELEQLSLAVPQRDVLRTSSDYDEFKRALLGPTSDSFTNATTDETQDPPPQRLPNLRTLHMTTWPSSPSRVSQFPRVAYEHLLQLEATTFFTGHVRPPSTLGTSTFTNEPKTSVRRSSDASSTSGLILAVPPNGGADQADASASGSRRAQGNSENRPLPRLNLVAWGVSDKLRFRSNANDSIVVFARGATISPITDVCRAGDAPSTRRRGHRTRGRNPSGSGSTTPTPQPPVPEPLDSDADADASEAEGAWGANCTVRTPYPLPAGVLPSASVKAAAHVIPWLTHKYVEPRSEVLDFLYSLDVSPPDDRRRRARGSDDGDSDSD
ncbi:MAG: hypothetical protein M1831_005345 [Alyxoria varia]|nr:MAG: hypothetical protein M1831_005345 [Alyxoria varia]